MSRFIHPLFLCLCTVLLLAEKAEAQGCDPNSGGAWGTKFGFPGASGGEVRSSAVASDGKMYFGGSASSLFGRDIDMRGIASWNGEIFQGLGEMFCNSCGGTATVFATAADDNGNVFFGGRFTGMEDSTGTRVTSPNVVGFNTNTGTFFAIGNGVSRITGGTNDDVFDLHYRNDTLFIAGEFNRAEQTNGNEVISPAVVGYDLSAQSFFGVDGGIYNKTKFGGLPYAHIQTIAEGPNNELYFGGQADSLEDGTTFQGLISWHPQRSWEQVPPLVNLVDVFNNGQEIQISPSIYNVEVTSDGDIIVSGAFRNAEGNGLSHRLAINENGTWDYLEEFRFSSGNGHVEDIFIDPNDPENLLFTGTIGNYNITDGGGDPISILAGSFDLNSKEFSPIIYKEQDEFTAAGPLRQTNFYNNQYYFLGATPGANSQRSVGIVRWDGQDFLSMGEGIGGNSGTAYAYEEVNGKLLVAGDADGYGSLFRDQIAYWTGSTWQRFEHSISEGQAIHALKIDGNTLWIGGNYNAIDNVSANGISTVNLSNQTVTTYGDGVEGGSETVFDIEVFQGQTFIGGNFDRIDNVSSSGISMFDGNNWMRPFELNGNEVVHEILNLGDTLLVVSGDFTEVDGNTDYAYLFGYNGSNLVQLWGGSNGVVNDVLFNSNTNTLEVAGDFTEVTNIAGNTFNLSAPLVSVDFNGNISEKPNLSFNNVSEGIDEIELHNNQTLFIGGNFSTVNGQDFGELFSYTTNGPSSLEGSLQFFTGGVKSLYINNNDLWVGGGILRVNSAPSTNIAKYAIAGGSGGGTVIVDMIPEDNIQHYDVKRYCIPNPEPGANYVWSNGDTGPCTMFTESGYQTVTATGFPCYAPDSVLVDIIYAGFTRGGYGDGFDCGQNQPFDLAAKDLMFLANQETNEPQELSMWIINNGSTQADQFTVELLEEGELYFRYNVADTTINPGDSILHNLLEPWVPEKGGVYELCGIVKKAGDSIATNDTTCVNGLSTVGIAEVLQHNIRLYPNPVKEILTIAVSGTFKVLHASLYDATGRVLIHKYWQNGQSNYFLDCSNLAPGAYQLHLRSGEASTTQSIIIAQ